MQKFSASSTFDNHFALKFPATGRVNKKRPVKEMKPDSGRAVRRPLSVRLNYFKNLILIKIAAIQTFIPSAWTIPMSSSKAKAGD